VIVHGPPRSQVSRVENRREEGKSGSKAGHAAGKQRRRCRSSFLAEQIASEPK
jgi:hypothetical protein